jgi:hypothetical protein
MEYIRINVQITPEQHDWLREQSFVTRKSIAEIIREMVEQKMKGEIKVQYPIMKIIDMTQEQINAEIIGREYSPSIINQYDWIGFYPIVEDGIITGIIDASDGIPGNIEIVNDDYARYID